MTDDVAFKMSMTLPFSKVRGLVPLGHFAPWPAVLYLPDEDTAAEIVGLLRNCRVAEIAGVIKMSRRDYRVG